MRSPLWVVVGSAFLLRAAYVLVDPYPFGVGDSVEYDRMGRDLLEGRGFVDYFGFVRPPLYPMFVAVCYAIGGIPALQFAQVVLSALSAGLVGILAVELSGRRTVATAAGLIAAVYPWPIQLVGKVVAETLFTFLAITTFIVLIRASRAVDVRWTAASGVLLGATALVRTNMLALAPLFALWLRWSSRRLDRAVLLGLATLLMFLPFTLVNVVSGKGIIVGSSGGGINFYGANNPATTRLYTADLSDDEWRELNTLAWRAPESLAFLGCAPVDFSRIAYLCLDRTTVAERERFYYAAGLRYVLSDPAASMRVAVLKTIHYWRPWVDPRIYPTQVVITSGISFALVLLLALISIRTLPPETRWFIVLVAAGATMTAVIWGVQLRYRFALLDPILIAAAGAAVTSFAGRGRTSS